MRIFFGILGAGLIAAGLFFSIGAVDVARSDAGAEQVAQGFLAVGTLIVVGLFTLWFAWKGRG